MNLHIASTKQAALSFCCFWLFEKFPIALHTEGKQSIDNDKRWGTVTANGTRWHMQLNLIIRGRDILPPCTLVKSSSESDSRTLTESNHASSWHITIVRYTESHLTGQAKEEIWSTTLYNNGQNMLYQFVERVKLNNG